MNYIKTIIIGIVIFFGFFLGSMNIGFINNGNGINNNIVYASKLDNFYAGENNQFKVTVTGERGIYYTLLKIAQSLKNLFFILATLFFLIIVLKLLFTDNSEEGVGKFKTGLIWITVGLIIMQTAYSFTFTLYAKNVGEGLVFDFINNIINPFIGLLDVFASFVFLAIAIFAFFRLVTANGKEEDATKGKMTIVYAIIGFILLKLAKAIVEGVYGKLECHSSTIAGFDTPITKCITDSPEATTLISFILTVINWINSFVALAVILLVIYAGFNIFISAGNEEKIKKAKSTIIYIVIGIFLLVINYLILTFFILPRLP